MKDIVTQADIEKSIKISKKGALVRSDVLAKMFGRTHKQVLATIRQKVKFLWENNFPTNKYFIEEETERKSGGATYSRYQLTRRGFDLVSLSLKGKKAEIYKLWYIEGYHSKQDVIDEHKLIAQKNTYDEAWLEFREEGKVFRTMMTDAIKEHVVKYREGVERKMNDGRYYQHYTNIVNTKVGIILPKGVNARDVANKRQLIHIEEAEEQIAQLIIKYTMEGIHYKEVFRMIKKEML